ncbi:hypothetical protein JW992_01230 [candidate division KSB1 bacterium]|nr:hypothetical protein [candidate division KSB1 bacterium]
MLHLCSFGFHKSGIPADTTGHGGGYVFDCRSLPNPGREPAFADLTGQDAEVIAFLQAEPRVQEFLSHVLRLVLQHAQNYGERGFTDLTVCFGCTGGRHRSVYCAELAASELRRHGYRVELEHIDKPD